MRKLKPSYSRTLTMCSLLLIAAGTSITRADYSGLVTSDNPKAYYRFNDPTLRTPINHNSGSLGAAGDATNDLAGIVHPFPGAIVGDRDGSEFFDFSSRTEVPWSAAINPPNTQPFTVEAWFYPASDQTATGQAPIANRFAWSGVNRQGWVFFQRKPSSDYIGGEQVGWNFRMYNQNGSSFGLDVTSLVPYEVGKWTHVVVVYDPLQVSNATISMYIDGVFANSAVWTGGADGTSPGYVANSNDHTQAPANLSIGNYNNTAGTSLNPYFGAVDEFALYATKLTPDQILAHYQNGTNANRSVSYDSLIKSLNPVEYLRLNEKAPGSDVAVNLGDVRSNGLATNGPGVRHAAPGAVSGEVGDGAFAYHNRNGKTTTQVPFLAENNPGAGVPFTFEAWLRPMRDLQGGQCPVNNRWVGGTGRTGWVIFQRNPNLSYPTSEGHGWNFRMYSGQGSGGQDVITDVDYAIGKWQHLVVTWEPQADNGDPGANGNDQWQGVLTAYVDGFPVASNTAALYAANRAITETANTPADLAIGSYNAASGLGNNPYEGQVDELAIYNNYVLTPDQILDHYMAGTNSHPATNYATLVLTAPFTGPERQGPKTYLRFNDPPVYGAVNSGSVGFAADAELVLTANTAAGPRSPAYPGFDSANAALTLDGTNQWACLNNPAGLNIQGGISLEAWVKPGATQGTTARIISHGPETLSDFLALNLDGTVTNSSEVFLRIEDGGATYSVGASHYDNNTGITNTETATFPVPTGDLGSANWIHLVGTFGANSWALYRNGAEVARQAGTLGALLSDGAWAIGATGNGWADNFAGSVDEVAVYNYALTANQVRGHYNAGTQEPKLNISRAGNQITITWPYGTLYQADDLNGPWTAVSGNPSFSFTTTAGVAKRFYRF